MKKHLKGIWQLWSKYFLFLMRKTGLEMISGAIFFSLGASFVAAKQNVPLSIFTDNAATIFFIVAAGALCIGVGHLVAEMVDDDDTQQKVSH